jgi:hypothetical protein
MHVNFRKQKSGEWKITTVVLEHTNHVPNISGFIDFSGSEEHGVNDHEFDIHICSLRSIFRNDEGDWIWYAISRKAKKYYIAHNPKKNAIVCSCGYPIRFGIPCRHFLKIWSSGFGVQFMLSMINMRWYVSTHIPCSRITFESKDEEEFEDDLDEYPPAFFNIVKSSNSAEERAVKYGEVWGLMKKAIRMADEQDTLEGLHDTLLLWIRGDRRDKVVIHESYDNHEPSDFENHEVDARTAADAASETPQEALPQDPLMIPVKSKKRPSELAMPFKTKSRKCGQCKETGHNRRNCPNGEGK